MENKKTSVSAFFFCNLIASKKLSFNFAFN
jgi:hypothetical protein